MYNGFPRRISMRVLQPSLIFRRPCCGSSELTWDITKMKGTSFQVLLCSATQEINVVLVPITKSLHPQKVSREEEET